jgi:hypothetical protein
MKIADLREAAMEWTVTIEGPDEFGEIQRAQMQIEKGFERLASGEIGLSIDDGKRIMSTLQEFVVKQELATYALARRVCVSCERLRPVKDYTSRKIRTVFGTVVVKSVAFPTFPWPSRFSANFAPTGLRPNSWS